MNNGTPGKNITNEELNELPLGAYDGEVVVISDPEKVPHAFHEINEFERIGFDTETKPSPDAKVVALPRVGGLHHPYEWRDAA